MVYLCVRGRRGLRVAWRLVAGWVPQVRDEMGDGARALHRVLGEARDLDVLEQVVEPALQRAGAPGLPAPERSGPHTTAPCHPAALVAGDAAQRWLRALPAWPEGPGDAIRENPDA